MNTQSSVPFPDLPEGTVTFLFTDIEGSTCLLYQLREGFAALRCCFAFALLGSIPQNVTQDPGQAGK